MAQAAFEKGNYQEALELLKQSKNQNDKKTQHNMALCQYMLEGKRHGFKLYDQLLLQSKFYEKALDFANDLFDIASDLPHWLAVRTGLLIAELGLQLSREEGELSPQISNRVTYSLDWIDARISLPKPPASDGMAPEGKALKLALHTYRSKFALLAGQKNTCKRELKAASDVLDGSQGMCLAVVRAQLHFSLSDYDEALVHLNPPSPSEAADEVSILAKGLGGMRVVLYTNYVCVLIFRGELERAQAVLQAALQLTTNPCPDLYLLQAYLTLKRGDKKSVVLLLKRGRPLPRRAPKGGNK